MDGGRRWLLVARVARPATEAGPGGTEGRPEVQKAGPEGLVMRLGGGRIARLAPETAQGRRDRSAVLVNVSAGSALFRHLLPPVGAPVMQVVNQRGQELPAPYAPQVDDVLLVTWAVPNVPAEKMPELAHSAAAAYSAAALQRLTARGKKPVSGILSLTARAAPGDTHASVVFVVDGRTVCITNAPPYRYRLNTREYGDGEHVIEVRAYDAAGTVTSRVRQLTFFRNEPAAPQPGPS